MKYWILGLLLSEFAMSAPPLAITDVLHFDTDGMADKPTLIVNGPKGQTITFMWTREKLEKIAADPLNLSGSSNYAILALEIIRLREKCGEPHTSE